MLILFSLNHRHSTVVERAGFALGPEEQDRLYRMVRSSCGGQLVYLSTCNRVEVVTWIPATYPAEAVSLVREIGKRVMPAKATRFLRKSVTLVDDQAVTHVMRVAGGLESLAAGDVQVLGQVREAYRRAHQAGTVSSELHRLFQTALGAGRRIHRETGLGVLGTTVGKLAAEELLTRVGARRFLVIGAGRSGAAAAGHLRSAGAEVVILNRTLGRAQRLAHRLGAQIGEFENRHAALARADGAVIATGSPEVIISSSELARERIRQARQGSDLLVLDLSVPLNCEPTIADLPGIDLRTLDQLPPTRANEELAATRIVNEEAAKFRRWISLRGRAWAEVA